MTRGSEFFSGQGKRTDAELHEPILAGGDKHTADLVSRTVMTRLGLSEKEIDALSSVHVDKNKLEQIRQMRKHRNK